MLGTLVIWIGFENVNVAPFDTVPETDWDNVTLVLVVEATIVGRTFPVDTDAGTGM
jgi:hypothetical protein